MKKQINVILPVVSYGRENWYLVRREKHKSKMSENRVPGRILGLKREEVTRGWRNYITRNFITCTLYQMSRGMDWAWHAA
jgi:hypothetical protein